MKTIKLIISLILVAISSVACSNNSYNKAYLESNIIYITDESNILDGKKIILVKNTHGVINKQQADSEINTIVAYAKNQPDVIIRITYITAKSLATYVAKNLNQQIDNKIYIDKCCTLDVGRAYLPNDSVSISLYK